MIAWGQNYNFIIIVFFEKVILVYLQQLAAIISTKGSFYFASNWD